MRFVRQTNIVNFLIKFFNSFQIKRNQFFNKKKKNRSKNRLKNIVNK